MNSIIRNIIIFLLSATCFLWGHTAFSQTAETVVENSVHSYTATGGNDWSYNWTLTDPDNVVATLVSTESLTLSQTEDITFTKQGEYMLSVQAVNDQGCLSKIYNKTITVIQIPNLAPVAVDDEFETVQGAQVSGNLLDNDSDPDGDNLVVTPASYTTTNGTSIILNGDGSFTYTPNSGFVGVETFSYELCDDAIYQLCDEGEVTVTVSANRPPVAVNDGYAEIENTPITGNVLDNDSDPDGDELGVGVISLIQGPEGTLTINVNGGFTFTPPVDFVGTIIYEYEVCDDAVVPICESATLSFNYSGNTKPYARNDVFSTNENTALSANVLDNDSDSDGDDLIVTSQTKTTTNGSVIIQSNGDIIYTPNAGFFGSDTFSYELCDNGIPSKCDQATVSVTVLEVVVFNRETVNDIGFVFEGGNLLGQVLQNDILFNGNDVLVNIPLGSETVNGNLQMNSDGRYTYQPNPGFIGTDNFYYEACASEIPVGCDNANVTVQVLPVELTLIGLVLADDELETAVNIAVSGNVLVNDFSPIDDELQINTSSKQGPDHGQLVISEDGSFLYTPETGFVGEDYFVYEVCGLATGDCRTARVTIRVKAETESKIFAVDDVVHIFSNEIASGNLLSNDISPAGKTLSINITPVNLPLQGTVSISSNGNFSYIPTSDAVPFVDQFVYEVCDQNGNCSKATVYLIVSEEPEFFADVAVNKLAPTDATPGEMITYEISVSNRGNVTAENVLLDDFLPAYILNAAYTINGTGNAVAWPGQINLGSLEDGESVLISIRGFIADNAPNILENFASVNSDQYDPNLANNVSTVQTNTNRVPIIIVENGLRQSIGCCYDSGLQLDASQSIGSEPLAFLWEPAVNLNDPTSATPLFTGSETTQYTLTVSAANGESSSETVTIEVEPCPQIVTNNQIFVEAPNDNIMLDASASIGTGLSYSWWTANNEIIISGESKANPVVSGLGKYYLQITDSMGCTDLDSVTVGLFVQIQAIDDSAYMLVNTWVDINVIKNDFPKVGVNPGSVSIVSIPEHGNAVVTADSIITYTPDQYYVGRDEFTYTVCDFSSNCDEAIVLVIINDEALFVPNAFSPNGDGYNDLFVVKGIGQFESVSLKVFNRWGNQVYEGVNYGIGTGRSGFWDGIANKGFLTGNGQVPTGTYYYILDLGDGNERLSGFIYLDR